MILPISQNLPTSLITASHKNMNRVLRKTALRSQKKKESILKKAVSMNPKKKMTPSRIFGLLTTSKFTCKRMSKPSSLEKKTSSRR